MDNTPAYGWVARLVVEGDDLFAEVDAIDPLLADAIRVGMYRKISASLYLPESPSNPVPGVLYLRHVGLLGGAAPAVKGLAPVTLSEGDGVAEFEEVCRNQSEQGDPAMSEENPELAELKAKLTAMGKRWRKDVAQWELDPGDLDAAWAQLVDEAKFHPGAELTLGPEDLTAQLRAQLKGADASAANGSSIAFLAEYAGKSCLFLADAHMKTVCASIRRLLAPGQDALRVDAVKLAHHGSRNNLTPEFMQLVDAEHFLFSSNGDKFKHPDAQAVQAVIHGARRKPTLWFNYRSAFNERWEAGSQAANAAYATRYPEPGAAGITVPLLA